MAISASDCETKKKDETNVTPFNPGKLKEAIKFALIRSNYDLDKINVDDLVNQQVKLEKHI